MRCEKYCRVRQATDNNMAQVYLIAGYLRLQIKSQRVILISSPLQQWLPQCASLLCFTYTACLILRLFINTYVTPLTVHSALHI